MSEYTNADAASPADGNAPGPDDVQPMTDDELQAAVTAMIDDAEAFVDGELAPLQQKATEYYQGKPFGNEEEGRSQVVYTVQRDVVTAIMPSLMRAFFGPERVVEFVPLNPNDVEAAEQETDYINDVVMTIDNPGFLHTYSALKDGLVRTFGIFKWWWEPGQPTVHTLEGASDEQLMALLAEEGTEITKLETYQTTGPLGVPATYHNVELRRAPPPGEGFARFAPLPPEELIFSRDARSRDEALLMGHRSLKTTSELLDMGIPLEVIEEHGGMSQKLTMNPLAIARNPAAQSVTTTAVRERAGEEIGSTDRHDYYEMYPYVDADGDHHAELRKVCLLGPGRHVVSSEPASERPFALFVPDPEPHTIVGLSVDDYTSDVQRIMSFIFRMALDGFAANLTPRFEVVEDKVEMADVLSHELGLPIRVKEPNVVRAVTTPFPIESVMPMLEFTQGVVENRIGITRGAAGLNPDALQSSTQAAVAATVEARQQRIELFARIFAETGFKQLLRGLRRLIVEHQPRARMVRIRGKYVEVDPRTWDTDRDVRVNVALGLGFADQKVEVLTAILQDQKEWLTQAPGNPLVGLDNYRATVARILKLRGYPNADEFYRPIPPGYEPPPPPPAPPDPAAVVAQAEVARTNADIQRHEAEFQLKGEEFKEKQRENDMLDAREREKTQADIALRARELELKYQGTVDVAQINADMELERERIRKEQKIEEAHIAASAVPAPEPQKTEVHVHAGEPT